MIRHLSDLHNVDATSC